MAGRVSTRYKLADPQEVERDGKYIEIQPVMKEVTMTDGQLTFVKQEKIMAESLSEFRETYPDIHVIGVPSTSELSRIAREMSDEDLAKLGLARSGTQLDANDELFASEEARVIANEAGLSLQTIKFSSVEGSGRDGRYTAGDVRDIIEQIDAASADEE